MKKYHSVNDDQELNGKTLYAFYDLAVSPATFDIATFIALAEIERIKQQCKSVHIVIVPGPNEGFRDDHFTPYDSISKRWRLYHIIVPCCWLLLSCRKVSLFGTREEALQFEQTIAETVFPPKYSVENPVERYLLKHMIDPPSLSVLGATFMARSFIGKWVKANVGERKIISITLRECAYQQERNSNLKEWAIFAKSLDGSDFCPVLIRDAEAIHEPIPSEFEGILCLSDVIWNIDLRAALYELSYLNLFVNCGPSALCDLIEKARSLTFKMITPAIYSTSEKFFIKNGLKPGSQLQSIAPFHRWVWEEDRYEVIAEEFESMCTKIESSGLEEDFNRKISGVSG